MYFVAITMSGFRAWTMKNALIMLQDQFAQVFKGDIFEIEEVNKNIESKSRLLEAVQKCDLVIIAAHGSIQVLHCFSELWSVVVNKKPIFFHSTLLDEVAELVPLTGIEPSIYKKAEIYFKAGDVDNIQNMLLYLHHTLFQGEYSFREPKLGHIQGIYTPQGLIPEEKEVAFKRVLEKSDKAIIGVIIHPFYINTQNTEHIDALIEQIEEEGAQPYAIYAPFSVEREKKTGLIFAMERYFRSEDGCPIPDSLIVTYGFSISTLSGHQDYLGKHLNSIFESWDIPVIQALTTYFNAEQYEKSISGLDTISLPICVFETEFDGQIISVPIATSEMSQKHKETKKIYKPIKDRVKRVAQMAHKWSKLKKKANKDKKVAIIFHNMPPRNDTIGSAHGLDTPETVYQIIKGLKKIGINTKYDFEDGREIIEKVKATLTNDNSWIPPEKVIQQAAAVVDEELYLQWFNTLPNLVQEDLVRNWGKPPGKELCFNHKIGIPGILNGNVFIGIQPLRAGEKASEMLYHSTDDAPTHAYIAYYQWIQKVFEADVIIHVGTHGTLEWLPGKEVGLSSSCYSDICIGALPHLYIYNIGILGEGIQTKRRSYAAVVDHLIPSMEEADTYEELTIIDEAIDEYYHAIGTHPAQAKEIAVNIFNLSEKLKLNQDLGITLEDFKWNEKVIIEKIHLWIGQIKHSMVRDGLHILGQVPQERLLDNLSRLLVRIENGNIPALNDAILIAWGLDPREVKGNLEYIDEKGETYLRKMDEVVTCARRLFWKLRQVQHNTSALESILQEECFDFDTKPLKKVMEFVCTTIIPAIASTTDEIDYLLKGIEGKFIMPGRGGNPTRGRVDILPTGRNFYAIDPSAIPSRVAWSIGQKLAAEVIKEYQIKHAAYPESIAIIIYSDSTMKTHGEDIAQVLALMGVRPLYLGNSNKVIGLEAISLEELGRPRIDVVLRISGLFRDAFPNLIELVERAVLLVGSLDEDEQMNWIKKHIKEEQRKLIAEGLDKNQALNQASVRVFGCPRGQYGAGVGQMIHNHKWESIHDLSEIYALWSGNAYSTKYHGEPLMAQFKSCLKTVNITVKNESSVELDMLDCDDFYSYHGGLIACVHDQRGELPLALTGISEDPSQPQVRSVQMELARVMRSRVLNPKWLEGLKRHEYKGAQEISKMFDVLFGWDATTQIVENWMYEGVTEKFLLNEDTRQWMEAVNPHSVLQLSERLLEANQRGMWEAPKQMIEAIQTVYMEIEGVMEESY